VGDNSKESNNEMIGDENKNTREHSLNFLSNFLQTYNQNLNAKTTNAINPSGKEKDTVLGDILSSNHEMVLGPTEKIVNGKELPTVQNTKKPKNKSGKRDEIHEGRKTDQTQKSIEVISGRRRGQKKAHRQNDKIQKIEIKQVTKSQAPVFRSYKRKHSNLQNDLSTESPLDRTKGDSNISRNITDKNKIEAATTATLEINSSNLFLSRFMGIQRTKRPDKAPAKVNNKIVTQTKVPTKSVAKYPLRHPFSPVATKPVLSTDYPEEERATINTGIPESQANSIKTVQAIRGLKRKFSRKSFKPDKGLGNSDQELESKENRKTPDDERINFVAAGKQSDHGGRVVPNRETKARVGFDKDVVEKIGEIDTPDKKKSGEDDNKRFAGRLSSERTINRGRSSFNRGRGNIHRGRGDFSNEENVIESSSTSRTVSSLKPFKRPMLFKKPLEYSQIVRSGQSKIKGEEENSEAKHISLHERKQGTFKEKDSVSHNDFSNVSIPQARGNDTMKDQEKLAISLTSKAPIPIKEELKSSTEINKSYAATEKFNTIKSTNTTIPTTQKLTTTKSHTIEQSDNPSHETVRAQIGRHSQNNANLLIVDKEVEENVGSSKSQQKDKISLKRRLEKTKVPIIHREENDQLISKTPLIRSRARGSLFKEVTAVELKESDEVPRRESLKRTNARGDSSKKQENMQSNDGQTQIDRNNKLRSRTSESTTHHIRGRLRGSLPRKQNRLENVNSLVNEDENYSKIDKSPFNKTGDQIENREAQTKETAFRERLGDSLSKEEGPPHNLPQRKKDRTRSQTGRQRGSTPQKSDKEIRFSLENNEGEDSYRARSKSRGRPGTFPQNNGNSESSKLKELQSEDNQLLEITEAAKTIESSTSTIFIPDIQENVSTQEREDDVIESSGDESPVTYIFFPSSSPASQANYEEIVVSRPDIETEAEDIAESDLSVHLASALDMATLTWVQDPYREDNVENEQEGRPVFDIDFSKRPRHQ